MEKDLAAPILNDFPTVFPKERPTSTDSAQDENLVEWQNLTEASGNAKAFQWDETLQVVIAGCFFCLLEMFFFFFFFSRSKKRMLKTNKFSGAVYGYVFVQCSFDGVVVSLLSGA